MLSFLDFVKTRELLDQKVLQGVSDTASMARASFYEQLYKSPNTADAMVKYETLSMWFKAFAKQNGIPCKEVSETKGFSCDTAIYDTMGGADEKISSELVPLISESNQLSIAVTNKPDDELLLDKIARVYGDKKYYVGICSPNLWTSLQQLFVEPELLSKRAQQMTVSSVDMGTSTDVIKDSEARRVYRELILVGIKRGASDIHFIPCTDICQVLYRMDGINQHYIDIPKMVLEKVVNIIKTDGGIPVRNPKEAIDGKVRFNTAEHGEEVNEIDLRVSIIPTKAGPDLNIRYLSSRLYTFDELGMTASNIKAYKDLLDLPSGLVIQVGPTGSGKSTTLYAGLSYIHESLRNIITAEDPVEILMDGISQIDVDSEANSRFDFSDALKACLRHDPDVVVVGELRDKPTALLAVRASNTGHLVLSSLHTNDSIGAFERLINMGVEPYSLGEVVAAIMGQRLVRRLCPFCKKSYELDLKSEQARYFGLPNKQGTMVFYKPVGCVHCNNTGYKGRIAINEILLVDSKLRNLIQRHAVRSVFEESLRNSNFKSMYEDGLDKAVAGITSLEELYKYAADTLAFKGKLITGLQATSQ